MSWIRNILNYILLFLAQFLPTPADKEEEEKDRGHSNDSDWSHYE